MNRLLSAAITQAHLYYPRGSAFRKQRQSASQFRKWDHFLRTPETPYDTKLPIWTHVAKIERNYSIIVNRYYARTRVLQEGLVLEKGLSGSRTRKKEITYENHRTNLQDQM